MSDQRALHDAALKKLADHGRLIEAGFMAMRISMIAPDAPQLQIDEMRMAYMSGAQHLFASIMAVLDPGRDPTERDLTRMTLIHSELEAFRQEMFARARGAT